MSRAKENSAKASRDSRDNTRKRKKEISKSNREKRNGSSPAWRLPEEIWVQAEADAGRLKKRDRRAEGGDGMGTMTIWEGMDTTSDKKAWHGMAEQNRQSRQEKILGSSEEWQVVILFINRLRSIEVKRQKFSRHESVQHNQ